jgi:hypothetical protein
MLRGGVGQWLTEIDVIDHAFNGYFQTKKYRYIRAAGGRSSTPVRHQRVRALITKPVAGQMINCREVTIRGLAWSGLAPIEGVRVRVGHRWHDAHLLGPPQPHSWRRWELHTRWEQPGNTTLRARATDLTGRSQPDPPAIERTRIQSKSGAHSAHPHRLAQRSTCEHSAHGIAEGLRCTIFGIAWCRAVHRGGDRLLAARLRPTQTTVQPLGIAHSRGA